MESLGVIVKITEPTDWVNSMVIVQKPGGSLRVCIDPYELNQAIKREHYKLPTTDELVTNLAGVEHMSVLDVSNAFWQIKLTEESSKLCTFNMPFGRYRCLRLPFGICSATEIYQRTMQQIFEGMDGVHVYVDDILVTGKTKSEHDANLRQVLQRAQSQGLKFSRNKCQLMCLV